MSLACDKNLAVDLLGTSIDMLEARNQEILTLRAQRDELLKALQAYVQHAEQEIINGREGSPFRERLTAGRAAIAKALGKDRSAS